MWEPVTIGQSGARVSRGPGRYRKESTDPRHDLPGEGARLVWLSASGIPAARVLECEPGLLLTETVRGRSGADPWPVESVPHVIDAFADFTRALHSLPIESCPFDRRRAVTIPEALTAEVDLDDLDEKYTGWTRDQLVAELLATRPDTEDLVVCHGDLGMPNILFDPVTHEVTGVVDVGRLGVADRWCDLALATRSIADDRNPQYAPALVERFLRRYGIAADPVKNEFYRLLDEFF